MTPERIKQLITKEIVKQQEIERLLRWHEFRLAQSINRERKLSVALSQTNKKGETI